MKAIAIATAAFSVVSISGAVQKTQDPPTDLFGKASALLRLRAEGHIQKEEYISRMESILSVAQGQPAITDAATGKRVLQVIGDSVKPDFDARSLLQRLTKERKAFSDSRASFAPVKFNDRVDTLKGDAKSDKARESLERISDDYTFVLGPRDSSRLSSEFKSSLADNHSALKQYEVSKNIAKLWDVERDMKAKRKSVEADPDHGTDPKPVTINVVDQSGSTAYKWEVLAVHKTFAADSPSGLGFSSPASAGKLAPAVYLIYGRKLIAGRGEVVGKATEHLVINGRVSPDYITVPSQ